MSDEYKIGTRVNLKEMLSPEGLRMIRKGQVMHFSNSITGAETYIKVIRAGFWRYEGEVVEPWMEPEQAFEHAAELGERDRVEENAVLGRQEGSGEPNASELLIDEQPPAPMGKTRTKKKAE